MAYKTKNLTEEKSNETRRDRSERRNCLRKCFHSFKYVIDHANFSFFLLSKLYTLLRAIPSVPLAASSHIASQLSQVYSHTNFLFEYYMNV